MPICSSLLPNIFTFSFRLGILSWHKKTISLTFFGVCIYAPFKAVVNPHDFARVINSIFLSCNFIGRVKKKKMASQKAFLQLDIADALWIFVAWKLQAFLERKPWITLIYRQAYASWALSSLKTENKAPSALFRGYANFYQSNEKIAQIHTCTWYTTTHHRLFGVNKYLIYSFMQNNQLASNGFVNHINQSSINV